MSEPVKTVALKIDGQAVSVPAGTNVLEAAKTIGVDISYFCYHPGLSSPAVCRQCLVEVKGSPKLVPSCYTPVAENMEVFTTSEKTLVARQQMLEFTLVNHPVDCPICDKAGECNLQRQYQSWDSEPSRIDEDKVHKPKMVDLGPTIVLDSERCILCTRCIRVCDEVAGEHQLEMAWRGDREQLTTAPGHVLDNPYSLNTVDVCPVGALTAKDFRFQMRVWELYTTDGICTGCATGCNVEIQHAQGRVQRLVPRENEAVNKFWMCDDGRLTYHELAKNRLGGARVSGAPKSIELAIAEAASLIKSAGPGLTVILDAQSTNEDNYAIAKLAHKLGATTAYLSRRAPDPSKADKILRDADQNPNSKGARAIAEAVFGSANVKPVDDFDGAGLLVAIVLGGHVSAETAERIGKVKTIFISPFGGVLADAATVVLPQAAWAELNGTYTNRQGLVQRSRAALEPPGVARPAHELAALLAKKLNTTWEYATWKSLLKELKDTVPAFAAAEAGRERPLVQLRFAHSRG